MDDNLLSAGYLSTIFIIFFFFFDKQQYSTDLRIYDYRLQVKIYYNVRDWNINKQGSICGLQAAFFFRIKKIIVKTRDREFFPVFSWACFQSQKNIGF